MTLLVVLFSYIVILAVLPPGSAGPACAKKNWQSQQCIERCKGKWGYPGFVMNSDPWGAVMTQKPDASASSWDAMVSEACGMQSSSSSSATPIAAPVGAIGNAPPSLSSSIVTASTTRTSTVSLSTSSVQSSSSLVSSSSSSTSSTSSSTPTPTSTSSSFSFAFSFDDSTTSTENFVPPSPTPTPEPSTTEEPTTSSPPPPPPTTSSSSSTPAPAPAPTTSTQDNSNNSGSSSGNSGSTSDSDIQAYLSAHNSVRAQHGAAPLTWSDDAAGKAQQWANNCVFEHSGGKLGAFGENLAAGTGSSYGIPEAIKSWTDEVSEYDPNNPQASHFTQVVWKATTQVGCAVQSCDGIFDASFGKAKFFVCEYTLQGNVIGQFAENVQV